MQYGYLYAAKRYYDDTGKSLKIYPVYCAETLSTYVIGNPAVFDPQKSVKEQSGTINKHLEDEIERLGNSLPEHKVILYK